MKQLRCIILCSLAVYCTAPEAKTSAPVLEEVIVTAQKRSESMQDVPVAVSAISGDDLANTGFRDVSDLAAQVPSLIVTTNASPMTTSFRIRRIGNEGNIPTFEPATALIIDGAFRSRSGLGLGDLVDVRAVEVLKGPQGTLYGKNAGAGVISITTQAPTDEFEAMLDASTGSDDLQAIKASLNVPLGDALAARFSLSGTQRGSLVRNITGPDFDDLGGYAIRTQLRYDVTDRLSSRLIIGMLERDLHPVVGDTFSSESYRRVVQDAGALITNNDPTDRIVEHSDRSLFEQTASDVVLTLEYAGDGFSVTAVSGFEEYEADLFMRGVEQMPLSIARFDDRQAGKSFSQELRFASDSTGRFDWMTGAFYYFNQFTRGDREEPEFLLQKDIEEFGGAVAGALLGLPGPVALPVLGAEGDRGEFYVEQDTSSAGLFGQVSTSLTDSFEIMLGLRYSWEEKDGSIEQSNQTSAFGCGPTNTNLVCTLTPQGNNFDGNDSWTALTGNINLSYFPADGTMLYGLYSSGFKAGGFSLQWGGASDEIRPFDQETINHFELGWKSEFWDRRARLNGAIFHTAYENFQNASFISLAYAVNNAEKVLVEGVEVESEWLINSYLTLKLNAAYIDAVYDEYTGGQCFYGRQPDNQLGQCNLAGENLPFAPKLTGNIALQWEQPLFSGDIYARLDYRYTDAANYSSELDPRHYEDQYIVGNMRIGWRSAGFDIAGWVRNVSDEAFFVQKAAANVATSVDRATGSPVGSFQAFMGEPRTAGATVRVFF